MKLKKKERGQKLRGTNRKLKHRLQYDKFSYNNFYVYIHKLDK